MLTLKLFAVSLMCILALDALWLGFLAKNFYQEHLGALLRKNAAGNLSPIWASAICVYCAIALGVVLFVLPFAGGNLGWALLYGACFGAISYGIYDFTNHAIISNWPLIVTIIDLFWGTFLCGATALLAAIMQKYLT